MGIAFRYLTERDIDTVAAIEADVYVFPWTAGNFRDSMASGYACWGAWIANELAGYAIIMTALDEAHLLNLAVASKWQRKGVAKALLRFLIDELKKTRCEMLYLEVRPSNVAGRALYEQFGFKQLGLRRDYYPSVTGREDALFLGLDISERFIL
jgi:ribosomal-protein-alanine N-acetyltransferase